MQIPSVENVFARAWELLTRNWIIIVPGLVIGAVAGILSYLFTPGVTVVGSATVFSASAARGGLAGMVIGLAAAVCNIAYTTGMAGAAWRRGSATLADGTAALKEDAGRILLAMLMLAVIVIVLAVFTLGVGAIVFVFFAIYTMPSVVLSNSDPWRGLKESFAIASKRWAPTLIIVLLLLAVAVAVSFVVIPFAFVPVVGPLISAVIDEILVAYATLVIVGEYLNLRAPAPPTMPLY